MRSKNVRMSGWKAPPTCAPVILTKKRFRNKLKVIAMESRTSRNTQTQGERKIDKCYWSLKTSIGVLLKEITPRKTYYEFHIEICHETHCDSMLTIE